MSEFSVVPSALHGQAAPLAGLSGEIENQRACLLAGATAAVGTPAACALEDMTWHIHSQLASYGAATDSIYGAITGAGESYTEADQAAAPK